MITVWLYGRLKDKFGAKFELAVKSTVGACRVLEANYPGIFLQEIAKGDYNLIAGDLNGGTEITNETLDFNQNRDIHIVPVLEGSGDNGAFSVILGAVLVVAAVVTAGVVNPAWGSFMFGASGITAGQFAFMGSMLILSGVTQMLTPSMEIDSNEESDDKESSIFDGVENNIGQGGPVPILYGELEIGSTVINGFLSIESTTEDVGYAEAIPRIPLVYQLPSTVPPPLNPLEGDLWFEPDTRILKLYNPSYDTWDVIYTGIEFIGPVTPTGVLGDRWLWVYAGYNPWLIEHDGVDWNIDVEEFFAYEVTSLTQSVLG